MPLYDPAKLPPLEDGTSTSEVLPQGGVGVGPYAALAGGQIADILSTLHAKQNGGVEGNPLLGEFGAKDIALKGAMSLPMVLLMRHLGKSGHPTLAKALGYGAGAALGGVAAHNMTVGNK